MQRWLAGLMLLLLSAASVYAERDAVTIYSLEELLDIDEWEELDVTIEAKKNSVWSGDGEIVIKRGHDFSLNGGEHPPVLLGVSLVLDNAKDGTLANLVIASESDTALKLEDCRDIGVSRCSFYHGNESLVTAVKSKKVSFEHCLFAEPLEGAFGFLNRGSRDVEFESCLFARCQRGSPALSSEEKRGEIEMERCVVFDYGERGVEYIDAGEKAKRMRMVLKENLFIPGSLSGEALYIEKLGRDNELNIELTDNEYADGRAVVPFLEGDEGIEVVLRGKSGPVSDLKSFLEEVGAPDHHEDYDRRVKAFVNVPQ